MSLSPAQFIRECRANVALMAAVIAVPLTGLVCGAIDFARYAAAQVELHDALAEGIERARLQTGQERVERTVREHIAMTIDGHIRSDSVEVEVPDTAFGEVEADISASARVETRFLKLIGIKTLDLRETVRAQFAPDPLTEIVIALGPGEEAA